MPLDDILGRRERERDRRERERCFRAAKRIRGAVCITAIGTVAFWVAKRTVEDGVPWPVVLVQLVANLAVLGWLFQPSCGYREWLGWKKEEG